MIGTPIHFIANEFELHQRMCTLLSQHFGHYKVTNLTGIETLKDAINVLNLNIHSALGITDQEAKLESALAALTSQISDLSITKTAKLNHQNQQRNNRKHHRQQRAKGKAKPQNKAVKPSTPADTGLTDKDNLTKQFYTHLHTTFLVCQNICGHIFTTLHAHAKQISDVELNAFNQVCGYFNLLGNILSLNMAIYQTHPIYLGENAKKIDGLLLVINNWIILLESYHLNYGESEAFNLLKASFVARLNDFKEGLWASPEYASIWPPEMVHPLSSKELEYHVNKKNERAQELGLPYHGLVITGPANSVYMASSKREALFFEALQKFCVPPHKANLRTQLLFYYNSDYGNVDVFDVSYNSTTKALEIINIHPSNSCAQHDFLQRLTQLLSRFGVDYRILACQANFGTRQQNAALYALRLSSLISKHSFTELEKQCILMPNFHDEGHRNEVSLPPIAKTHWFPVNLLGDKAVLLNSDFEQNRTTLKERFAKYERNYELAPIDPADPEMLFTYADDYRRRLSFQYVLKNDFQGLSLDALKVKLKAENDGQMVRRSAAGHTTSREFRFLVESFKSNPDNEAFLHLPAKPKEYTPLQWALKERKASRAALLLTTVAFSAQELSEKNKDDKNVFDYFKESKDPQIKRNPVLQRFLKR